MQYVPQTITAGTVTLRVGIVEITMFATTSQVTVPTVVSLIGRGSGVTVRTRILCNALLWSRQVKWSCYITLKSKNSNVTCYKPFDSNMKTYRSLFSCRYHQFSGFFFYHGLTDIIFQIIRWPIETLRLIWWIIW